MDINEIISQLRSERDRIDRAIAELEPASTPSVQPYRNRRAQPVSATAPKKRGRKSMTPAERKRLSEVLKKRWAERKREQGAASKKSAPVTDKKVAGAKAKKQAKAKTASLA
jgi:hypothetical protein